jgi:hypothetical protein
MASNSSSLRAKAKRFLRTWEQLYLHPSDFFRSTLEVKRLSFWPALGFLSAAYAVAGYISAALYLLFLWSLDPAQPMDARALFLDPLRQPLYLVSISLGFETLLFYAVLRNWYQHAWAIKSTTPLRRIFRELAYANSPVVLASPILLLMGLAISIVFLVTAVKSLSVFESAIDDGPDWLAGLIAASVQVAFLLVLVAPLFAAKLYYYVILLTVLFRVSRRKAAAVGLVIPLLAAVPVVVCGYLAGDPLTELNLSEAEQQAARRVKSLGALVDDYATTNHRQPSIGEVKKFAVGKPEGDFYRILHARQIAVLEQLDGTGTADGYRYSVLPGRHGPYVRADPAACGGDTKRSFIGDAGGGRLCSSDRCVPATFTDTLVFLFRNDP